MSIGEIWATIMLAGGASIAVGIETGRPLLGAATFGALIAICHAVDRGR